MRDYWIEVTGHKASDLIFLDESGAVLNLACLYGYAAKGQRAYAPRPTAKGTRVSTIGALSAQGLLTAMCYEGTLNGEVFRFFIQEFLMSTLTPKSLLILDNASPHYNAEAVQLITTTGAKILYLPPYSPEMNPIEYCWATAKQLLRKLAPRAVDQLYHSWAQALETFDQTLATACFQHCGFCMKPQRI